MLSTTNGSRAIVAAADRSEDVVLGALVNLDAVMQAIPRDDVTVVCAGTDGGMAVEDVYLAGLIVDRLDGRAHRLGTDRRRALPRATRTTPRPQRWGERSSAAGDRPACGHRVLRAGVDPGRRAQGDRHDARRGHCRIGQALWKRAELLLEHYMSGV